MCMGKSHYVIFKKGEERGNSMNDLAEIEAILFVAGDEGLSLADIAQLTDSTTDYIANCLAQLKQRYADNPAHGITLIQTASTYKMVTKQAYQASVKRYAQSPLMQKLSKALIETLSIIAYKQPITRMEIEEIRGVSATSALQKLKLRQLIREVDRLDAPGNPVVYGTTDYFLDYFGLNQLDELPELSDQQVIEETTLFTPEET